MVKFNPGMAPSTVNNSNFTVTGPFGAEAGQVSFNASDNSATWITQPTSTRDQRGPDLAMVSNYTATISGISGGSHSFTFQTGPCNGAYPATTQIYDVPNSNLTAINGINNNGVMVGTYAVSGGQFWSGFILNNGQLTTLEGPGWKINDSGAVAGTYTPNGLQRGFMFQSGKSTDIVDPQATASQDQNWAFGINNSGVIVGYYVENQAGTGQTLKVSGYIRQADGTFQDINPVAEDINNNGHVVGQDNNVTWIFNNGTYTNVTIPGGCGNIQGYGINDNDDTVGFAAGCPSLPSPWDGAYVKRGNNVYQVVVPGCTVVSAYGINNAGVVVGSCQNPKGNHGFIATPK